MKESHDMTGSLEEKKEEVVEETTVENTEEEAHTVNAEDDAAEGVSPVEEGDEAEVLERTEEAGMAEGKKLKKHEEAVLLVEKAKNLVKEAEEQMEECKLLLSNDLKGYEDAKLALKEGGMEACEELLGELGYVEEAEEPVEEEIIVFEPKEDLEPIFLRDVSSGKFTGFLMGLIGGVATVGGMLFTAASKTGVTLDLSKVPTPESIKPLLGWYGSLIGMNGNEMAGGAVVVLSALLVMWIIYAIRVSMKGSRNLEFAQLQLEEAEAYTAHKGSCKEEMDKVDAHIHDAIETLKTYQVLFNEQKGKLERIMHIEGKKEELSEYHDKSLAEMKDTQGLINAVRNFIGVPMSEEGKLSGKSTLFLHSAKNKLQKMIDKLY
jgi:hypothetical protein